ncbi:hypothetical protein BCR37DRAFT_125504 [Protomyces lactucae-debilis]|uniref:Uncharacterized protein n=1 Tax=Protomyces lactucae-debilis TaxID=2754530 RepID=A0A1Y2FS54_PROLT|nr:uncharacterized protein BCR37DRAFT_125504 [Protomyces lactucae-debilis]ORY86818.1 hypothetical protein BCR37DRAFT_125504 [Protomyces lactucae-debilis]
MTGHVGKEAQVGTFEASWHEVYHPNSNIEVSRERQIALEGKCEAAIDEKHTQCYDSNQAAKGLCWRFTPCRNVGNDTRHAKQGTLGATDTSWSIILEGSAILHFSAGDEVSSRTAEETLFFR